MKKLLFIFLLFPLCILAQKPHIQYGPGEYASMILNTVTHTPYDATQGKPQIIPGAPANVSVVAGGAHHSCLIDAVGNVWCWLDGSCGQLGNGSLSGSGSMLQVTRDSIGNPFTGVVQLCLGGTFYDATGQGGYWNTTAVKSDGTVWACGNLLGGAEGNGTFGNGKATRFVQIPFPVGVKIKKVQTGYIMMALSTTGDVYTWGGGNSFFITCLGQGNSPNYFTPTKISLPAPCIDIAGASLWNYCLLNDGRTFGLGHPNFLDYLGVYPMGTVNNFPKDITSFLNFPVAPKAIGVNNEASYALLVDGTIWGWGGNANGTMGNGQELDYSRYGGYPLPYGTSNPFPYAWDQGQHELMQFTPKQIAPGKSDFTDIFTANCLVYSFIAEDINNNLYGCGRNKSSEICNGVVPANAQNGAMQSTYPNSWDVPWITMFDPLATVNVIPVSCPYCKTHSTTACNIYTIPAGSNPIAGAGFPQVVQTSTATLSGSASTPANAPIIYHIWTQISGPTNSLIVINSDWNPTVLGLTTGTYTYKLVVTNASWNKDSTTTTVTVGSVPPSVNPGTSQTLVFPLSSTTLVGSATATSPNTISSHTWSFVSGPTTASITSPAQYTTGVTSLTAVGVYTFKLTAVDNMGISGSATMTVTILNTAAVYPMYRKKFYGRRYKVI